MYCHSCNKRVDCLTDVEIYGTCEMRYLAHPIHIESMTDEWPHDPDLKQVVTYKYYYPEGVEWLVFHVFKDKRAIVVNHFTDQYDGVVTKYPFLV